MSDRTRDIETCSEDGRVVISGKGIKIYHQGKPIEGIPSSDSHVYLLVDSSGSMAAGDKINQAKKGAVAFSKDAIALGYSVGLISFDSTASLLCDSTHNVETLELHISRIQLGAETHMSKAIQLAQHQLGTLRGTRAIVVVTDGVPNGPGDPQATLDAGEKAKAEGIDIITIGTDDADQEFLRRLATRSQLSVKVSRSQLRQAITSSVKLLPGGSLPRQGK